MTISDSPAVRDRQDRPSIASFATVIKLNHQSICDSAVYRRDLGCVPPVALTWHTVHDGGSDPPPICPLQRHYCPGWMLKSCQVGGIRDGDESGGRVYAR